MQIVRDFAPIGVNIFQGLFLGVLLGLIFRDIQPTQQGVFDYQVSTVTLVAHPHRWEHLTSGD